VHRYQVHFQNFENFNHMFIKRDHRNLDEILSDSIDPRKYLKLSKR